MTVVADVVVIGGGIAGTSAAYELARHGARVVLLERESQFGYHATGRSAALFMESYGNATIRALSRAAALHFKSPGADFCELPLTRPRGALFIASAQRREALDQFANERRALQAHLQTGDSSFATAAVPILRPEYAHACLYDSTAMEIDVDLLLQSYVKGIRAARGQMMRDVQINALTRQRSAWHVASSAGVFQCAAIVNAAGAWADQIAQLAGVSPIGLMPLRRTAFTIMLPPEMRAASWPFVMDVDETLYFKPESGGILVSPANEDSSEPMDAWPEVLDVATGVDRLERTTILTVRSPHRSWAGLRTFAADRSPVIGEDPDASGFFWYAGQGGYGVQTAPAAARVLAASVLRKSLSPDLIDSAVLPAAVSPARFRADRDAAAATTVHS